MIVCIWEYTLKEYTLSKVSLYWEYVYCIYIYIYDSIWSVLCIAMRVIHCMYGYGIIKQCLPVAIESIQTEASVQTRTGGAFVGVNFTASSLKSWKIDEMVTDRQALTAPCERGESATKALVNAFLMELVAPVAYLISQPSAAPSSPSESF